MAATPSLARRVLGSGAMVIAGGTIAASALLGHWIEWPLVMIGSAIAVGGVGLSRKNLLVQSLSRASGWLVLLPASLATLIGTLSGHFDATAAALTGLSGAALVLARPMLNTEEAMKTFAPVRNRGLFLMGTTLSSMAALLAGLCAVLFVGWDGSPGWATVSLVIAAGYLASSLAVLRMRAWGVLLSGAMSLLALVAAAIVRDEASVALALAALPGLVLGAPIAIARLDNGKPHERTRVGAEAARFRVAEVDAVRDVDAEDDARPNAARMSI